MSLALIVLVAGTLAAAIVDLRSRRIPNALTAAMAFAAVALHVAGGIASVGIVLGVMLAVFALGSVAYSAGWFGGGDVKLIAAACGLAGYPQCVPLLLFILMAGGVLALAEAARRRRLVALVRNASLLATTGRAPESATLLPYGVAIAGGSAAFVCSTLLSAARFSP